MKKVKFNSFIILIISAVFIVYVLKDNFFETIYILKNSNSWWIALAILMYLLHMFFEAYAMLLITNQKEKNYSLLKMYKLQVMTKFFNGITPFATGGQPLQVYELKKEGVSIHNGTIIVVENFILFQTAIVIIGIISVIINQIFNLFKYDPIITNLFIVGFIINLVILIVVYITSISEKFNMKVSSMLNSLLSKLKIVKDKEKNKKQLNEFFTRYYIGFVDLRKNKLLFLKVICLQIASLSSLFLIPQFVFNGLNFPHDLNIMKSIAAGAFVFVAGSFVPIPGGTGGIEFSFLCFYANFVPKELLPPALIIWRFITYYAPMVAGGIIYNIFPNYERKFIENK